MKPQEPRKRRRNHCRAEAGSTKVSVEERCSGLERESARKAIRVQRIEK